MIQLLDWYKNIGYWIFSSDNINNFFMSLLFLLISMVITLHFYESLQIHVTDILKCLRDGAIDLFKLPRSTPIQSVTRWYFLFSFLALTVMLKHLGLSIEQSVFLALIFPFLLFFSALLINTFMFSALYFFLKACFQN